MTEQEKFIKICKEIWDDKIAFKYVDTYWTMIEKTHDEIILTIFTPEFMDKAENHMKCSSLSEFAEGLITNLQNPTQYLYDTLWLWTK